MFILLISFATLALYSIIYLLLIIFHYNTFVCTVDEIKTIEREFVE
jgi:hypothetical protein